jgi:hypothetical protein
MNRTGKPIPGPIIKRQFRFWKSDQIPVRFFLRGTGDFYRQPCNAGFYLLQDRQHRQHSNKNLTKTMEVTDEATKKGVAQRAGNIEMIQTRSS